MTLIDYYKYVPFQRMILCYMNWLMLDKHELYIRNAFSVEFVFYICVVIMLCLLCVLWLCMSSLWIKDMEWE